LSAGEDLRKAGPGGRGFFYHEEKVTSLVLGEKKSKKAKRKVRPMEEDPSKGFSWDMTWGKKKPS